jgi:hypothetical protein
VDWDTADFAIAGAMLLVAGGIYELAARMTANKAYRAAIGVALAAAFILVWLSIGVGIIGKDGEPANLMYFGVLAVGISCALIAACIGVAVLGSGAGREPCSNVVNK